MIKLPPLPFAEDALAPYISKETMEYHYGKHHKNYVDILNQVIVDTKFRHKSLDYIVKNAFGTIFNHAGQAWNHNFYWQCLGKSMPKEIAKELQDAINQSFGSMEQFKIEFTKIALRLFGSGWVWLVKDKNTSLFIVGTSNADNPLIGDDSKPLLTCDVWEHAYYIDYRNDRAKYLEAFWQVVNWCFVSENFLKN
jgi:Fe-Mn family superoxide dismutase